MADNIIMVLSWLLILSGSFFYLIGAIGLIRMPAVFTRMHAASVSDTLGAGLLVGGMMIQAGWGLVSAKLLIILAILIFTGPVATHALARAAIWSGLAPQLAEDRTGNEKRGGSARKSTRKTSSKRATPRKRPAKGRASS
jgi:multicomponent Na+:H+ antiporter subunit G